MKKHLLKVFLMSAAVAASGMMSTSCKDYDDDIDSLNQKIENLSGQVALKADQNAVAALQQKLEGIDFTKYVTQDALTSELAKYVTSDALTQELAAYVTTTGLDSKIAELGYQKKAEIESLIDTKLGSIKQWTSEEIADIFDTQIAAYDLWGAIDTEVADAIQDALDGLNTEISQDDINKVITAVIGQINTDNSDMQEAILGLLGEDWKAELLANYVTTDMLTGYVTTTTADQTYVKYTELDSKINAQLTEANAQLTQLINKLIDDAAQPDSDTAANVTEANITWLETNDLEATFKQYAANISQLWVAVGDLANRIQSLVYVPTTADGEANFGGYTLGEVSLTKDAGRKATMTFRVSPASLAQAIAEGYNAGEIVLEFLPEKVTRANDVAFTIEGEVEYTEEGKISMLVSTNYTYPSTNETYSVALRVRNESSATKPGETEESNEEINTGVEYTTAYIPTKGNDKNDIFDRIVLAEVQEDGSYTKCPTAIEYNLEYNNLTQAYKLFDETKYIYVYEEATAELISLDQAAEKYNWDYTPSAEPVLNRTSFTTNDATDLALNPEDPESDADARVTVGLSKAVEGNIGKTITDTGKLYVSIEVEGAKQLVKKSSSETEKEYTANLHITRELLGTIEGINAQIDWTYAYTVNSENYGYSNSKKYLSDAVRFDNEGEAILTADQFKALDWASATWEVETVEGTLTGLTVKASGEGDPYSGTEDSKHLRYTIENYANGSGKLAVSADVNVSTTAMVTLKGEITINGLDNMTYAIDMPKATYTVNGENLKVVITDDLYTAVYNANKEVCEARFGSVDNFEAFMKSAKNNFENKDVFVNTNKFSGLRIENNGSLWAFFKNALVDFEQQASYTYTAPKGIALSVADASFNLNLTGAVTISKDNNYYLMKGTDLFTDAEPYYMKAYGTRGNGKFEVANVNLANGYKANKTDGATVQVTYTLADAPAGYTEATFTYPTVSEAILNWNGCALDKVTVTAEMTVEGVLMDRKTFEVRLVNPIDYSKWMQDTTDGRNIVSVKRNTAATMGALNGVTLKDIYDLNVINPGTYSGTAWTENGAVATGAASEPVYGFAVEYGTPVYKVKKGESFVEDNTIDFSRLTLADGVLTVSASDAELAYEIEVTIPVKMTYKYSVEETRGSWAKKVETKNVVFIVKNAD